MASETTITIKLNTLHCNRESQSGGSNPYLWPDIVWINKNGFQVGEIGAADSNGHKVLKRGMKAGDTITIDSSVGEITRFFVNSPSDADPLSNYVLILTVGLFHDNETPNDAVIAGYRAFKSALETNIKANLAGLASTDQSVLDATEKIISDAVSAAVKSAISDNLSLVQKGEVATGILTLDSQIGSASTSFTNPSNNTNFTLTIGDPMGGRLLLYRDTTQNGTGDVNTPQVIGGGGWQQFKFLFPGTNNVIYAVNQQGQLLRYPNGSQSGGGVAPPQVIGQGGWLQFKFLFSGLNNVIYAVNQQGQLLRYVDASQTGGGDVSSPQVVGQGGWLQFKFLFSGGNNVIYAVNQQGQLLRYVDASQTGGGDVSSPQVIGRGGWLQFLFLFSGWNNIIYAVNQQGQLLFYKDASQTGGGDVSSPKTIGQGGWQQFGFLFSGGDGFIYAAEKALNPANNYEIAGTLTTAAVRCLDQRNAVNQATAALKSAKAILADLKTEFAQAPASQKPGIREQINEQQKEVAAAQATLDAANKALQACLNRVVHPSPPILRG